MYGPNVKLFEFKLDDKEHIIGIEVFATNNSVPGRIRFRTSHGRTSPWYGKSEIGKRYILPRSNDKVRDKNKKYAEEFIVGLHGCEGSSTLFSLGVILRQVEAVNVFSRCWMDRPDRVFQGEDEESSRRFVESTELLQQRQFNNVLAMRSADVLVARNRSLRLCLRMRYGDFIPLPLQSVRIVSAVTKWFFNALSHSLVKLTDVTDSGTSMLSAGGSDGTLTRGYQQIRSGTMLLKNSERRAKQLDELLHVGPEKTLLNEAQIGRRRFKELTEELAQKRIDIQQAEAMLAVGREVVEQGLANLPKLQTSPHSLGYYENLVHLAVVKETLKKQKSGDDS
mmetsp:Transcript_11036/g.17528  ORF Transcript_11036/g.17528 Transcript_11036/m.17528 type:complete len:338 (+) Transcript_11036:10-1023(+)